MCMKSAKGAASLWTDAAIQRHDEQPSARKERSDTMLIRVIAFIGLLTVALAPFADAQSGTPAPRLKPAVPNHSAYLDDHDFTLFRSGLRAASDGEWDRVRDIRGRLSDSTARNILLWRIATSDDRATFMELDLALDELAGWPQYDFIRREAEFKIATSGLSAAFISGWFSSRTPESGEGKIALGEALLANGDEARGTEMIRDAWRNHIFRLYRQAEILTAHRSRLRAEDHQARVDMLIWQDQRTAASALFPVLDTGWRRLAEARIRLASRSGDVNGAVAAVPANLANHTGLRYERARWRRRAGLDDGALEMLVDIPAEYPNHDALESIWLERRLAILNLIRDRRYQTAYQLASNSGLSEGADFADAEFLAGWFALRFLNRPSDALQHFTRLAEGVSYPVSVSRGRYWQGRAAAALGDETLAASYYRLAAEHQTTYYGQLAIVALDGENAALSLPAPIEPSEESRLAFESRPVVRALRLLGELDYDYYFRVFIFHLDDELENPEESVLLSRLAREYLNAREAVRAAKAAGYRWHVLTEEAFPVVPLPDVTFSHPEAALVHGVIRQETEFDPTAISGAGARGMMQMMPATARATARDVGMPYHFEWLSYDADYNMRLGLWHLEEVIDEFDGSYILSLAGYNAGGHRSRAWIENYGDPRAAGIDPIDWIEMIPFSETRNYVQRVLENTQVYRYRLGDGSPVPLRIMDDLNRGSPNG